MKFTFAVGGLVLACAMAAPALADKLEEVRERGALICGVLGGFEPFGFTDPATGQSVGYEPDLCTAFAEHLGVDIELKVVTAQGRIPELQQGRVDIEAALLGWAKKRAEQVDFSDVYATVDSRIMVRTDSGIVSGDELADQKIGVAKGSLLESVAQETFPNANVIGFDDTPATYLALKNGRIQGMLMTETTLASLRAQDPEGAETFSIMPEIYRSSQIPFAVRQGEAALLAEANAFLDAYEASGDAQVLWDKWFGANSMLDKERTMLMGDPVVPHD